MAEAPADFDAMDNSLHTLQQSKEVSYRAKYLQTRFMLRELKPPKIKKNKR